MVHPCSSFVGRLILMAGGLGSIPSARIDVVGLLLASSSISLLNFLFEYILSSGFSDKIGRKQVRRKVGNSDGVYVWCTLARDLKKFLPHHTPPPYAHRHT